MAWVAPGPVAGAEKPGARAAKPEDRPTKSILKKVDGAPAKPHDAVEALSASGTHKLLWRSGSAKVPGKGPAAIDSQVKVASASQPAAEGPKPLRKPTSTERAKRREEILRIRTEQASDAKEPRETVQRAAHLQPLARPRAGSDESVESPSIDELLAEPTVPAESELPTDTTNAPDEEIAPAAPTDLPGDMPSDPSSDVPSRIQDSGEDPFKDDRIPNNNASEVPDRGEFQLEEGNKGATGTEGCEDDKKECRDSYRLIKSTTLDRISLDISISGVEGQDFPCECEIGGEPFAGRNWSCITYNWTASALCHKPLYFEDPDLERYGHSWNPLVQPFISGAHFFATFPVLPYKMGLNPPQECVYSLGYYRPGNCAPYLLPPIPFSLRAAAAEAAAVGGAIAIIP